jgi:UDP-N-acetylenolpyruvoylglucosamine reductase
MTNNNLEIKSNVNLSTLTTFKIGGPAKYFCEIKNSKDLKEAIDIAKELQKTLFYFRQWF